MSQTTRSLVLPFCLLPLLLSISVVAQTFEARILGTITDQSGAAVPHAQVTITNIGTGVTRTLATGAAGEYAAPNLTPGLYRVSAEALGFKKVERENIRLEVGTDVRVDLSLLPGDVSETVRVTEELPPIDTVNDAIGGSFSNKSINELPLNGRDYQNLVVLRPGMQRTPGGGFESITTNGLRPEDNNFIVDGVDDNDPYYSGNIINGEGVQGTPGSILPIDAIQEFNTEENPSSEYGYKPGATINIGLKSGTNDVHGTAYYFGRNSALDARNFFNTVPAPQNGVRQHQFGGSVGGPILRDKLFLFGAYEGVRAFVSNANVISTPATVGLPTVPAGQANACTFSSVGDCANSLTDALADLKAGKVPLSPTTANLIGLGTFTGNGPFPGLLPVNTAPDPNNPTSLTSGFPNVNRSDSFVVKADYHLSERHSISGRYLFGDSTQTEQNIIVPRPEWRSLSDLRAQVFGVSWTWTPANNWVNEARFGYNRFWQEILSADHAANPLTVYGINTGVTNPVNFGLPQINFGTFTSLGNTSGWPLETIPNQTYQVGDNVSYTRGTHTLHFGGEYRRGSTDNLRNRHAQGLIRFSNGGNAFPGSTPLEDFLAGSPDNNAQLFVGNSERKVSFNAISGFVQDDWRITPHLTINAGLRYDFIGVIKEANNLLGNFDPSVGLQQVGVNLSKPYQNNPHDFGPRIGIAWDPTGKGKTVIRAGYSLIYEIPHISVFIGQNGVDNATTIGLGAIPTAAQNSNIHGTINSSAFSFNASQLNWNNPSQPVFPSSVALNCTPCDILGVTHNLRTPYVQSWNLNIQQALSPTTSVQVAYVGNHGVRLYSVRDINQVNPAIDDGSEQLGRPFTANCPVSEGGLGLGGPCFPFLGVVNFLENLYSSSYNALQVTAVQRVWHGLNFVAGYTFAHAIDDVTNNRGINPQNSLRPDLERASGDNDIRHRFTLALSYDVPGVKSRAQLLEGWQLNTILTLQTALPWSLVDGFVSGNDISLTGEFADRWNIVGSPANIKVSPNGGIPFFPSGNPDCFNAANQFPNAPGVAASIQTFGCFEQNGTILVPPAGGTFGDLGRNPFRAQPFRVWDFSVIKTTNLTERLRLQIRGEFFNILNHPVFGTPDILLTNDPSLGSQFGFLNATADVAAANPVIGTGGQRNIQLGLKFIF